MDRIIVITTFFSFCRMVLLLYIRNEERLQIKTLTQTRNSKQDTIVADLVTIIVYLKLHRPLYIAINNHEVM